MLTKGVALSKDARFDQTVIGLEVSWKLETLSLATGLYIVLYLWNAEEHLPVGLSTENVLERLHIRLHANLELLGKCQLSSYDGVKSLRT